MNASMSAKPRGDRVGVFIEILGVIRERVTSIPGSEFHLRNGSVVDVDDLVNMTGLDRQSILSFFDRDGRGYVAAPLRISRFYNLTTYQILWDKESDQLQINIPPRLGE